MFQAPFGVGFTPISFDRKMHVIPLENARKSIGQFDGMNSNKVEVLFTHLLSYHSNYQYIL